MFHVKHFYPTLPHKTRSPVPAPAPPLTPTAFQAETCVTDAQLRALSVYLETLEKWQKTINLVGRGTLADPWRRHILDSAQLVPLMPPPPVGRPGVLVDLGSGGGFPGLVLAGLLGPVSWTVHLVESDERKCAFLAEAGRQMGLTVGADLHLHRCRIEALPSISADVITARALAPLDSLVEMALPLLKNGGCCLFLKGISWQEELTHAQKRWKLKVDPIESRTDGAARVLRLTELAPA